MVTRTDWFPTRLSNALVMFQNVKAKIGNYAAILPLTTAQQNRVTLICDEFIGVYNYVTQSRATTESLVEWRDLILTGSPKGDPAPNPPDYAGFTPVAGSSIGIFTEFRELVDLIKSAPGYTTAIGEDLMIVAPKQEKAIETDVIPDLKVTTAVGYEVSVAGSMQGNDALRVEYQRNGATDWSIAAFLTKMPGTFTIAPHTPGQPETGRIRAIFIKKNADYGNMSPEYPVTLS